MDEVLLVFLRRGWFKDENLYQRPRLFVEVQAGLYYTCVIEHHQRPAGQVGGERAEHVLTHGAFVINEQFAAVALRKGELGYAVVREGIVIIFYLNPSGVHVILVS